MSYVLAGALAVTASVRAFRLRAAMNLPAIRSGVLLLAAMAVTFAVFAPTSQAWVNQFVPDLFKLIGNSSTLVAMFFGSALVLRTQYRPEVAHARIQRRALLLFGAVTVMVVMFFLPHPVVLTGSFDGHYAVDPTLVVYTLVYASYFGGTLISLAIQFTLFARASERLLRAALLVLASSAIVGIAHNVATIFIVFRNIFSGARSGAGGESGVCQSAFSDASCFVAIGTPAVAAAIAVVGFLIAATALKIENIRRWIRHRRAYRRLAPLWELLVDAFPEILRGSGRHSFRHDTAASNRVIEIRDGLLLLAPYRNDVAVDAAAAVADQAELTRTHRAAVTEAAHIVTALQHHANNDTPPNAPPPAPQETLDDLDAEIIWLEHVAEALSNASIIDAFRRLSIIGDTTPWPPAPQSSSTKTAESTTHSH